MIRLGSLAGYSFEGPRVLGSWAPPPKPGVYAILYKPDPESKPERYAVIYVGHADDLTTAGFPFKHPRAHCWVQRAGSRWKVYICTYEIPAGTRAHREQMTQELIAVYNPHCNVQKYDKAWEDHWVGSYASDESGGDARKGNLAPRDADGTPLDARRGNFSRRRSDGAPQEKWR